MYRRSDFRFYLFGCLEIYQNPDVSRSPRCERWNRFPLSKRGTAREGSLSPASEVKISNGMAATGACCGDLGYLSSPVNLTLWLREVRCKMEDILLCCLCSSHAGLFLLLSVPQDRVSGGKGGCSVRCGWQVMCDLVIIGKKRGNQTGSGDLSGLSRDTPHNKGGRSADLCWDAWADNWKPACLLSCCRTCSEGRTNRQLPLLAPSFLPPVSLRETGYTSGLKRRYPERTQPTTLLQRRVLTALSGKAHRYLRRLVLVRLSDGER